MIGVIDAEVDGWLTCWCDTEFGGGRWGYGEFSSEEDCVWRGPLNS